MNLTGPLKRGTCKKDPPPRLRRRPRVSVVFRYVPHYRAPFYECLRSELERAGVDLQLFYGTPVRAYDKEKRDSTDIPWGHPIETRDVAVGKTRLYWQRCLGQVAGSDLVIVEHANKLLVNYPLLLLQHVDGPRLAFWGHGEDSQRRGIRSGQASLREWTARRAHWWFAYTDLTADVLATHGVDPDHVTVVNNALDTSSLADQRGLLTPEQIRQAGMELGLAGTNVCAFLGSLYPAKRLPFLLESCAFVRQRVPDFELLIVGDGPDRQLAQDAAGALPWVHYAGARIGRLLVEALAGCRLLLIPGAVGLVILDSFALELPIITTAVPTHGPEIAYLRDGVNGVMVSEYDDQAAYADAVVSALSGGQPLLEDLRAGCRGAGAEYTLDRMVRRFARGIIMALES